MIFSIFILPFFVAMSESKVTGREWNKKRSIFSTLFYPSTLHSFYFPTFYGVSPALPVTAQFYIWTQQY